MLFWPDPNRLKDPPMTTRAGFVALIGEPNAGKSTLTNRMVGAKVSIVTHKVQTTRARIRGVTIEGDSQIVLVDTPGLFQPRRRLDRAMVAAAWSGVADADITVPAGQEVLIRDWRAEALFGKKTALVAAERLIDGEYIRDMGKGVMTVYELIFDTDHIIYAGGLEISAKADQPLATAC